VLKSVVSCVVVSWARSVLESEVYLCWGEWDSVAARGVWWGRIMAGGVFSCNFLFVKHKVTTFWLCDKLSLVLFLMLIINEPRVQFCMKTDHNPGTYYV
jgi:hypothetical protein